jgi:cyclophilin family peptidyl-prolyl cis-trans isomerase/HEAT repeat protein
MLSERSILLCRFGLVGILALCGRVGAAQQEAVVEQLAPLLAAEDSRAFDPDLFSRALVAPDSVVRRVAALSAGRIGDPRATPLLVPLLADPDSTVRVAAAFGLGLLRDSAAIQPLTERLTGLPALEVGTASEAVTALAKIGGPRSGQFLGGVLAGRVVLSQSERTPIVNQIVLDSWRLGPDAPVQELLPFMEDTAAAVRWRAVYCLGRLQAPAAANRLTVALRDRESVVRSLAARALTRKYAEASKLAPPTIAELLVRAAADPSASVRINALRSLAGYRDSALSGDILPQLSDPALPVQVQAATTLGELGGAEAAKALGRVAAGGKGTFAVRREALIGLARADPKAFVAAQASWQSSRDWRVRAAAAEAAGVTAAGATAWYLGDRDGRVVAAGLQAWAGAVEGPDAELLATARRLLRHTDAGVRSVAADAVARAADPADLTALATAYRRSARDSFPDAALSALNAILDIRKSGAAAQARVDQEFLQATTRPNDYLVRRWAEDNWPQAAAKWGPAYPIATGRGAQDYRDVVRRYLVGPDSLARPHVTIETEQVGPIEIELLGPEAPLTVSNFLRLVNRRFFDGNRWHRVVPNFVIQDGDPRGDGFGGPGGTIRDEINRLRYDGPMLGMALSGPDTGSSQWFINLSPQPHLDGTYTVFGKVVSGTGVLARISQGDVIRTIRP